MGRDAAEAKQREKLKKLKKAKTNKANIKGRSSATMGGPSMLTQKDDYKKEKSKPKGIKGKVVELKMFKGEMIPKKEYDLIMATRKALGKNMGGMMKKKPIGYNKGGMSKKGKSGYMYGGMTKSKKK